MTDRIISLLKENSDLFAYNVTSVTTYTHELHLIKQKLDLNRASKTSEYEITVYVQENEDGTNKIGTSRFKVNELFDDDEIREKIAVNITYARNSLLNEYKIPKKKMIKPVSKEIGFDGLTLQNAAFIVADSLFEADKFEKSFINSASITISFSEIKYTDSNENNFINAIQKGKVYMVASSIENDETRDIDGEFVFTTLDTKFITAKATSILLWAADKAKAIKTPALSNIRVVFKENDAKNIFEFFTKLTNNDYIYERRLPSNIGYAIQKPSSLKQDLLTIRLEPTLPGSSKNQYFDNDGVVLKRTNSIEKGVVRSFWGSNAISQALNHSINGKLENILVTAGTMDKEELEQDSYLEIGKLADYEINYVTGDFRSEIILANLYVKGKPKQPLYSGTVSGNIYSSLSTIRFSNTIIRIDNYQGPDKIIFDDIRINKGE